MMNDLWKSGALENGFQFQATVEREKFALTALIHIPIAYPRQPSLLILIIKSVDYESSPDYQNAIFVCFFLCF